jgi:hypothetical protein
MAQEGPQLGEQFSADRGGPPVDRKAKAFRKIVLWGAISATTLAGFIYSTFFGLIPAVREYQKIVRDEAELEVREEVRWEVVRQTAEGPVVLRRGVAPAEEFVAKAAKEMQGRGKLVGYLTVRQFRPSPTGAYVRHGEHFVLEPVLGAADTHPEKTGAVSTAWMATPVYAHPASPRYVLVEEYGPYRNLIVNAGEGYLVDAWQALAVISDMRFHGIGTGTDTVTETHTTLLTELTTQYNPDNTRATGSRTEGAHASVFRSVGTNTVDATAAILEWGLFHQAATGGGIMWSRVIFSVINLASGDSLQTTYDLVVE